MFLLDQNELVAKVFDGGVVEDEVRQGPTESVAVVLGWGESLRRRPHGPLCGQSLTFASQPMPAPAEL